MKEIKAGQRVTIILEAVEQNGCDGCLFDHDDTCYNPTYNDWADGFQCEPEDRSDGKHVIFKEVKKQKRNYYEVTYNKVKDEFYLDAYKKFENRCIQNK